MPIGTRWPSGEYTAAALVALDVAQVELVSRSVLNTGVEAGLGAWVGVGVRLPSGRLVELVQYLRAPEPRGFEVRVDSADNCREAFAEFLRAFNVTASAVLWVLPAYES